MSENFKKFDVRFITNKNKNYERIEFIGPQKYVLEFSSVLFWGIEVAAKDVWLFFSDEEYLPAKKLISKGKWNFVTDKDLSYINSIVFNWFQDVNERHSVKSKFNKFLKNIFA